MPEKDKTTEASKVELTDEQIDDVNGGAFSGYLKIGKIESRSHEVASASSWKLNTLDAKANTFNARSLKGEIDPRQPNMMGKIKF